MRALFIFGGQFYCRAFTSVATAAREELCSIKHRGGYKRARNQLISHRKIKENREVYRKQYSRNFPLQELNSLIDTQYNKSYFLK